MNRPLTQLAFTLLCLFLFTSASYGQAQVSWEFSATSAFEDELAKLLSEGELDNTEGVHQPIIKYAVDARSDDVSVLVQKAWYFSDRDAINNYGTESIAFDEVEERVRILNVKTILPNGTEVAFDVDTAQLLDSDNFDVFTSTKVLAIPFAGLRPGSAAIVEYEITSLADRAEAEWSQVIYPQNLYPRNRFELSVEWSQGGPLLHSFNDSEFITCFFADTSFTCSGEDIPEADTDYDVLWGDELGQLVLSRINHWDDLIVPQRKQFDQALAEGSADEVLDLLIDDAMSLEQKISAIHRFVAQDIRYISASESGHAYRPHDFSETVNNRYGDCKDKSVVLARLLAELGIESYPVLVNTDRLDPGKLGQPGYDYFNHMVVCFDFYGQKKCLDATDSYTNWQTISPWIQGKVALALTPGSLPYSLPASRYRWDISLDTLAVLTESGGLHEVQERIYKNEYAGGWRGSLSGMDQAEVTDMLVDLYHETISSYVELEFDVDDLHNLDENLLIRSTADYEPFTEPDDALSYYDADGWVVDELNSFYLYNEVYDSRFHGLSIQSTYEFDIGSNWILDGQGAELDLVGEYGSMTRRITQVEDARLRYETSINMPARVIPVDEIERFNEFLDTLTGESIMWVYGKLKP